MKNTVFRLFLVLILLISTAYHLNAGKITNTKDSLKTVLMNTPKQDREERAIIYIKLIDFLKYTYLHEAFDFCNMGLEEMKSAKDRKLSNAFLLRKGELERLSGEYDASLQNLSKAVEIARMQQYKEQIAYGLLLLAKTHLDLSMFDLSYANITEAKRIFLELKDKRGEREVLNLHGCILLNEGKTEESETYFLQSMAIDSTYGFNDFLAADWLNLGLVYGYKDNTEKAKDYYLKALKIGIQEEYTWISITAYINLSYAYNISKQTDKALVAVENAIALSEQTGAPRQLLIQASLIAGDLYLSVDDRKNAEFHLLRSLKLAKQYEFYDLALKSASGLSTIYLKNQDYKQASSFFALKGDYADSSAKRRNISNLTKLRYESIMEQQKQENHYKENIRNLWFTFIFSGLILIIIVLISLFSRNKLKLKNSELRQINMANEMERKKKEVFTKIMYLRKKNESIASIAQKLLEQKSKFKSENQIIISGIVKEMLDLCKDDSWKEFELRFEEVYTDFFTKLNEAYPDLTPNERRMCAYLRLNITTKEIAALLHLSVAGVESARYRLRKKMNISNTDVDIVQLLESL